MKMGTRGYYAVMAMVDLAVHSTGRPVTLASIAERQGISLSYLEQLFGRLRKGELVNSVRGPGGGYVLSRPPERMRVSDIFYAVNEPLRQNRCSPGSPQGCAPGEQRCIPHDLWEELGRQIHLFLSSLSLADVLESNIESTSHLIAGEEPVFLEAEAR
jgi:Rrf2 family iron-sulfur cluster assembly transcriptional regulator